MRATEKAYIAGFLDGDGSIHIRLKPNKSYRFGFQIAPSIVFYQSVKEINALRCIRDLLKCGYIRKRKDGIVEYILGDSKSMLYLLDIIIPYLRFKKRQAMLFREVLNRKKSIKSASDFYHLCKKIDQFQDLNYSKKRKNNSQMVKRYLVKEDLLTP